MSNEKEIQERLRNLLRGRTMPVREAWFYAYSAASWARIRGEDSAPWEGLRHYLEVIEFDLGGGEALISLDDFGEGALFPPEE